MAVVVGVGVAVAVGDGVGVGVVARVAVDVGVASGRPQAANSSNKVKIELIAAILTVRMKWIIPALSISDRGDSLWRRSVL